MSSFDRNEVYLPGASEHGVEMTPYFTDKGFTAIYKAPAGKVINQHRHKTAHDGVLLLGRARIQVDGKWLELVAPATVRIPAHKVHAIESMTAILWACVWADVDGALTMAEVKSEMVE